MQLGPAIPRHESAGRPREAALHEIVGRAVRCLSLHWLRFGGVAMREIAADNLLMSADLASCVAAGRCSV